MKNLIFIIALIAFVGCKEEAPTEQKINLDKEYTLEELENDPNWVEITDIDTLGTPCINPKIYFEGEVVSNKEDFDKLYSESINTYGESNQDNCFNDFDLFQIDTNKSRVLLYFNKTNKYPIITRKVFKNINQDYLIYFVQIEITSGNEAGDIYLDRITIPKTIELKIMTSIIE